MASPNIKSTPDDRQLLQPSCIYRCINPVHGNRITAALTITESTDKALINHMLNVCVHFSTSRDAGGRTALHVAASTGRTSLIEWLVNYRGAKLDQQDTESGYTPLHRSLYYGKLHTAVELIKMGANLSILDHDHLSPLELVMIDQSPQQCPLGLTYFTCPFNEAGELYVWGSNTNYTLGPSKSPTLPELLVEFHKEHPTYQVTAVCLEKYHCVITCDNVAFSWGHGLGGRLGLNTDSTVLTPRHIKINLKSSTHKNQLEGRLDTVTNCDTCQLPILNFNNDAIKHSDSLDEIANINLGHKPVVVATARDHSIFLDAHDKVLTCGLNTHSVLGRSTEDKDKAALVPQPIPGFRNERPLKGVSCGRYHSVAYNGHELFTWGLNGGQLGHGKEAGSYVPAPKRCVMLTASIFEREAQIVFVVCSSGATAVVTSLTEVFILHEYQCRKITSRLCPNIMQVALLGGQLANTTHESEKSDSVSVTTEQHELIVAILTDDGTVFIWRDSDPVLLKCTVDGGRSIVVCHLALNKRGIALVTSYGEVFTGAIKERRQREKDTLKGAKKGKSGLLTDSVMVALTINKVPRIHRAMRIACDLDGDNFIVIQNTQYRRKPFKEKQLPILNAISSDMAVLLNDSSEDDLIHDFTFKVKGKLFYCHRFILAYAGKKMYDLVVSSSNNLYEVNDINVDVFEQLLQYIYTRSYDVSKIYVEDAKNVIKLPEFTMNNMSDLDFQQYLLQLNLIEQLRNKLLLVCAIRFGVEDLIEKLDISLGKTHHKKKSCTCKVVQGYNKDSYMGFSDVDIICKGNVILKAHKCVLVRAEYFKSLFSLRWNEKTNRTTITLDINNTYVSLLLDFLYMDTISTQDYDTLLNLLSISDEFMIHGLKELCEYRLKQYINFRTVTNLLQCSFMYTSPTLQTYCMRFICDHPAELLELRTLEKLDKAVLKALSEFYCSKGKKRQINPVSFTVEIKEPPADFNLATLEGLHYQTNENKPTVRRQRGPRKSSTKLSISEPDNELSTCTVDSFSEVSQETDHLDNNNGNNCTGESSAAIRVRAIATATERIKLTENNEEDFVNLSSSFLSNESFPDLNASAAAATSPTGNTANFAPHGSKSAVRGEQRKSAGAGKLSQKARKRLLSEKDNPSTSTSVVAITNPWKLPDVTSDNLTTDIDKQEKEITHIVKEERTHKDNLIKMQNKLLSLTQIEDQAILYLEKFYNIDQVDDEIITVERVEVQHVAIPKWISKRLP